MIKRIIQQLTPGFLFDLYKKKKYRKILESHEIKSQTDLIIAKKLVNQESSFIDIGANIGLYTKYLAPFSKETLSFEPVPFTYSVLKENIKYFNLRNVKAYCIAISDQVGETQIEIPIQSGVYNYYRASLEATENPGYKTHRVATETIDSLFGESVRKISLVKCDVEGHELSVIKGADKFLKTKDAPWLIEISENPDTEGSTANILFGIMSEHKFKPYYFDGEKLYQRKFGDESINYFFLKEMHRNNLADEGIKFD
ncbi:MAG: FkbM family methyltransferase [Balneolaceae bacterium]